MNFREIIAKQYEKFVETANSGRGNGRGAKDTCENKRRLYLQCVKRNPRFIECGQTGGNINRCSELFFDLTKHCEIKNL